MQRILQSFAIFALTILPPLTVLGSTTPIPLDDLVKHSEITQVKISPTGSHIAVRKLYEGEHILVFMSLSPVEITGTLRFSGDDEVGDFYWANDERIVAEVMESKAALEASVNYGLLFAIDYDGSNGEDIFGWTAGEKQTGSRIRKAEDSYAHATIIDPLIDDDNEIMISTYPWARDWETHGNVYRLDIYSGVKKRVTGLPQVGGRAFTDGYGNLLFANGSDRDNNYQLYRKEKVGWSKIEKEPLSRGSPVGFDRESNASYLVIDRKGRTEQLLRLDMDSGKSTPLFAGETSDIEGIITHPEIGKPLGVYTDPDYPEEHFFDEGDGFAPLFRGMKKAFDGYNIAFTSFTRDGRKGVLRVYGDRLPGDYFLVDLPSRRVDFLLSSAQWLDPERINPMRAESFETSDGLRIGIYLTFPEDGSENLPMVVMPHGGPHARDYWGYNRDAQILSQNGYLVLQVNFRGSTGYGDGFYNAGRRQWGGKIQRDIAEAAHWAVDRGYADRERICIYGASFGGYSALMNPIRYPDLYQCAVGYAGAYDLGMIFEKGDIQRRDRGISYLRRELSGNKEFLHSNSPLYNTGKLDLPLFIIHGEEDERVPVEHAKLLLEKLEKEQKSVEAMIVAKEGHGFYSEENNKALYTRLLGFLDRHIGIGASEK